MRERSVLCGLLLVAAGCRAYEHGLYTVLIDGGPHATDALDVPHATDATLDAPDATLDAAVDAGLDAVPADVPVDRAMDAPVDAAREAAVDAVVEAGCDASGPPAAGDQILNGGFESSSTHWVFATQGIAVGAHAIDAADPHAGVASERIDVAVADPAATFSVQLFQVPLALVAGTPLEVAFWARAAAPRTLDVELAQSVAPYAVYCRATVSLSMAWQNYTLLCNTLPTDPTGRLAFNFAASNGSLWLDDVSVTPPFASCE